MGGFGTTSVAIATAPTVISTFLANMLCCAPGRRPTPNLGSDIDSTEPPDDTTYRVGLETVRKFLEFSSGRGIEEVQAFTAMQVPTPYWIRRKVDLIPDEIILRAAQMLTYHLDSYSPGETGQSGIGLVNGSQWWRMRGRPLEGEWIETQKDYLLRKKRNDAATSRRDNVGDGSLLAEEDKVILYVHGGAYFFASNASHRYQVQRHARKAGARAFCPEYRLAPQYPFPCALLDILAAYLYLLYPPPGAHAPISPSSITLMGDSAGASLCLSLLVLIREMELPMPAGASLISPWVDLTHSMPSIGAGAKGDFIPTSGFHFKPSVAWPPLPGDGVSVTLPNGDTRTYDEQIQMYCPNDMLTHPMVSPINQGSLGGLCPLFILGGGAELLRDEIIYIAHKAANPTVYPPSSHTLRQYPGQAGMVNKYPPTKVHLQIHDGACHVVTTLSWTRSARNAYRECAKFNVRIFSSTSPGEKKIDQHLPVLPYSSSTTLSCDTRVSSAIDLIKPASALATIDPDGLVPDVDITPKEMPVTNAYYSPPVQLMAVDFIAERVSVDGKIRPFEPISQIPALDPALRDHIGQIHPEGAMERWLAARAEWDEKHSAEHARWREIKRHDRANAERDGYLTRGLRGERPPLASLAGWGNVEMARQAGKSVDGRGAMAGKGIMLWMEMGSKTESQLLNETARHSLRTVLTQAKG